MDPYTTANLRFLEAEPQVCISRIQVDIQPILQRLKLPQANYPHYQRGRELKLRALKLLSSHLDRG